MLSRIKQWLEPPYFNGDEELTAQARALNALIINFGAALLIFIFLLIPFFAVQKIGGLILLTPPLIGLFIGRALIFRRKVRLGSALIIFLSYLSFFSFTILAGGPNSPGMFFISALILITGFFLNVRAANYLVILTILIALGIVFLESQGLKLPKIFVFTPLTGWIAFALGLAFMNSARNLILQNLERALSAERQQNTLLQQAKQSLHESEERFKAQYMGSPTPTFTWKAVGNDLILIDYNISGLEFTSGRIVKLLGKTASLAYHDDPGTFNEFLKCARTKSNFKLERWHRLASTGEMKYVAFSYAFVPPDLVMVHTEDITERKRMEDILRESEETYKLMFETAPLAINITHGTEITYANPSFIRMFGFSSLEELKSVAPVELFTPESRPQILENIQRRAKGLTVPDSYESECFRKDGTRFPILMHLTRTTFADGPATVAFILDITENKRAEEALRSATADYRAIFENTPVGVFQSTPQGRFRRVNPAMALIFGYASAEEMVESITDISRQIYVNAYERQKFQSALTEHGEVIEFIGENYRKDKSIIWTQTTARVEKDKQGNILLYEGFITDITERRRAEIQNRLIAEVQENLLRSHEIEDIYQLVSEKAKQLIGDGITLTSVPDKKNKTVHMGPYHGLDIPLDKVLAILGIDPRKKGFSLDDMSEEELRTYRSGKLELLEEGLYALMTRLVPKQACYIAEKILRVKKVYVMGFVHKNEHVGGLIILARNDITPHISTIEQIVNLATIAVERKLAEEEVENSEKRFHALIEHGRDNISLLAADGTLLWENPSVDSTLGYEPNQFLGHNMFKLMHPDDQPLTSNMFTQVVQSPGSIQEGVFRLLHADGTWRWIECSARNLLDEPSVQAIVVNYRDISERKQSDQALQESETQFRAVVQTAAEAIIMMDARGEIISWNTAAENIFGYSFNEMIGTSISRIVPRQFLATQRFGIESALAREEWNIIGKTVEVAGLTKDGREFPIEMSLADWETEKGIFFTAVIRDISERKEAEKRIWYSERKYHELFQVNKDGIAIFLQNPHGPPSNFIEVNDAAAAMVGYTREEMLKLSPQMLLDPGMDGRQLPFRQPEFLSKGIVDFEASLMHKDGHTVFAEFTGQLIQYEGQPAIMNIVRDITERKHHENELHAIATLSAALRTAETRTEMLPVIVKQLVVLLNCETASIEIIDPLTGDAVTEAAYGAWESLIGMRQKSNTGVNVVISKTRQPYFTNDLKNDPNFTRHALVDTDFHGGIGIPLIAQDHLIGFIWMGRNANVSETEVRLLTAISDIAANAIYRSTLHEQTKKDAADLALAYDTTLEGWARALELRDQETEGHTRRVVQMTIDLARLMGIRGVELENIRRGALLHDIGKMGIPDSILLKNGPLDENEWEIMRQHPEFAYKLLEPITYLRPVLEIPHYHHEKWDGTGYPHSLKGEKIPVAARIFAIIDVWDALTSDRPYRPAWPKEKTLAHIIEQAGKHFDPAVVEAFLKII